MIVLLASSSIILAASQASINAPRDVFRDCLKGASDKASNERVGADSYDAYVRNACSAELTSLKGAVVKFDMGNKMSRKASVEDADLMVGDYVGSALERYKYVTGANAVAKASVVPAPSVTPQPVPASAPK